MESKFFDPNRPEDDFKIHIDNHGQWFHEDSPITRERLIKLFSTALHYNETTDEYWLITPHEQGRIEVSDTPFVITDYKHKDEKLTLISNIGEEITPSKITPIFIQNDRLYTKNKRGIPMRLNRFVNETILLIALDQTPHHNESDILYLRANDHDHIIALP